MSWGKKIQRLRVFRIFTEFFGLLKNLISAILKSVSGLVYVVCRNYKKTFIHKRLKRADKWRVRSASAISLLVLVIFMLGLIAEPIRASSTWQQSDWSGGTGSSTSNQYASASNVDDTSGTSIGLSSTNLFTNPSFDSDANDWNGVNNEHETSTKLSGAGSAKITAGSISAQKYYGKTSTPTSVQSLRKVGSGDVNNDGIDDIVITDNNWSGDYTVKLLLGNGDGTLGDEIDLTTPYLLSYRPVIKDVNADGWADIILSYRTGTYKYSVFLNDGSGSFSDSEEYGFAGGGGVKECDIVVEDFDDDDMPDVAFNCATMTTLEIYTNDGDGTFTLWNSLTKTQNTASGVAASDINGDGLLDIAISQGANTLPRCSFYYRLNNGAGFEPESEYTYQECEDVHNRGGRGIVGADVNNDGYGDIITCRNSTGWYMTVSLGGPDGVLDSEANYVVDIYPYCSETDLVAEDLNGDGYVDVLLNNYSDATNNLSVLLNNQDGTFGSPAYYSANTQPYGVTTAELNGDGRPDIVAGSYNVNDISILVHREGGDALTQAVNVGDEDEYFLGGYVYTDGSAVSDVDAELFANGEALTTSYSDAGSGWYKLTASVTGADELRGYGVLAKAGKTIYVDDMALYKYSSPGVLTSNAFSLGYGGDWGALTYTTSGGGTVEVKVRSDNSSDMSGAADFSTCPALASGTDLTGQACMNNNDQYVQYQVTLTYANGEAPPVLEAINIEYSAWDTDAPTTNASNLAMLRESGGDSVASNGWTNGASPYFSWDSGADNGGGSGVKGYCLYLGADQGSDPVSTKGLLGTSPLDTNGACQFAVSSEYVDLATSGYLASALTTSNNPYYLAIKVIDNADNVYSSSAAEFQFRFDNTKPTNPSFITAPSQFVASKEQSLTWPTSGGDEASDANSGIAGLQYRIGNSTPWYGDSHTVDGNDDSDLLANDGEYTTISDPDFDNISDGNNIIYFRTWDNAGNVSTVYATTVLKINTSSPSSPQNVTATPSTNTTNSFAFSWAAPASYTGSASNITYCYTVNTLPNSSTCPESSYTDSGVSSLDADAYATQPGENTFYVVARDEASNVNYATAASATFTANTPSPGMPSNLDIVDISVKTSSNWRLALSWDAPSDVGAGVSSYKIYRSTDNSTYTNVASTSGTSYVDAGLTFEQQYYYKIKACDSANNCGALTGAVNDKPTGKYTEPASATSSPKVSNVSTRKATVNWSTNRGSDSRIQYGTKSGQYFSTEAAISDQVTYHEVPLNNLAAGTTYYAKARWTDEDGNTGSSAEFTFRTSPAPQVKEVTSDPSLTTSDIRFTSKDAAKVKIYYGQSESFGGLTSLNTSLKESKYATTLNGLDDGTKYFFKINTLDADGNEYEGNVYSFTTPPRPRISNLRFQPVKDKPSSTQKVSWDTNVAANSELSYGIGGLGSTVVSQKLTTKHELVISGLVDDSTYALVARSRDASGNQAVSDRQTFKTDLDTRPPKITDVVIDSSIRGTGAEARGQVVLSWKTDEPATSQVAYGEGSSGFLSSSTSEDGKLTTDHVVVVSDLSTSRVYHFEPRSYDKGKNEGKGEQKVAIIGRASENVLSIIFNALQQIFGIN